MIQINLKIVRNGFNMCDVTYGDFDSFEDAAKNISKKVTELANSNVGYFSQFNQKMLDDDHKFAWSCSWDNINEIVTNNGFCICDSVNCCNKSRFNSLEWNIVVSTSNSLLSIAKYLEMK